MLERKTTRPDELQKLTLALRDFERRLRGGGRSISRPSCRTSLTSCRSTRTSGKGSSSTSALKLECEGRPRKKRRKCSVSSDGDSELTDDDSGSDCSDGGSDSDPTSSDYDSDGESSSPMATQPTARRKPSASSARNLRTKAQMPCPSEALPAGFVPQWLRQSCCRWWHAGQMQRVRRERSDRC